MEDKETKLDEIISTAIALLYMPPNEVNIEGVGKGIVSHHPFFSSPYQSVNGKIFNIFEDEKLYDELVNKFKNMIEEQKNVFSIIIHINKPYRLLYFSLIKEFLSKKEYAEVLKDCWIATEYPHRDVNISVEQFKDMFTKANRDYLMSKEERKIYNSLDEEVTIYRGYYRDKYYKALSWTLDLEKAKWFAKRYSNDKGIVYKGTIKKQDIFAYFMTRNEKEVIVDYNKINDIEVIK